MPIKNLSESSQVKKILILMALSLLGMLLFILFGLTFDNMSFNLPRRALKVLAIAIVSFSIGYSSIVFQTITGNRILTPGIMGLDSLYMFIQTVVVYFFGSRQLAMMTDTFQFFISGIIMVGASLLLYVFLFNGKMKNIYFLVLIGIIFGGFFNGLSNFMQMMLDPNEFLVLQGKMFASFSAINIKLVGICLVLIIFCIISIIPDLKRLNVLSLGEDHAINLGINCKRLIRKQMIVISVLISVSTVLVGPVTFLGLLVASLAREVVKGYKHGIMIIAAFLIGNIALIYSLFMVERLLNFSATINVIIDFIGGIYFIYLITRNQA